MVKSEVVYMLTPPPFVSPHVVDLTGAASLARYWLWTAAFEDDELVLLMMLMDFYLVSIYHVLAFELLLGVVLASGKVTY
jgi:hypothetical protein